MVAKKRKKRQNKKRTPVQPRPKDSGRNQAFDTLRGLAVVLMIVDHVAGVIFEQSIEIGQLRFLTRLSMPLFCVLAGYLVAGKTNVNWSRILQVAGAAILVNAAYVPYYGLFEILVSLLICYLLFAALKDWTMVFAGAAMLYSFDPTAPGPAEWLWNGESNLLDYPLSIVIAPFAIGIALKKLKGPLAFAPLLALLPAFWLVPAPSVYVLWFTPLAVLLVNLAERKPILNVPALEWIGRYPLRVYVVQYLVVLGIALLLQYMKS